MIKTDFSSKKLNTDAPFEELRRQILNTNSSQLWKDYPHIAKDPYYKALLMQNAFPTTLGQLDLVRQLEALPSADSMLYWYSIRICECAGSLNAFLKEKESYDYAFLFGQYDLCETILTEIEKRFGQSFWLIRANIALLGKTLGPTKQVSYYVDILSEIEAVDINYDLLLSYLTKTGVTTQIYRSLLRAELNSPDRRTWDKHKLNYIQYRMGDHWLDEQLHTEGVSIEDIQYYLYYADSGALIDRYLFLRELIGDVFLGNNKAAKSFFLTTIELFADCIQDAFWKNVLDFEHQGYQSFKNLDYKTICKLFDLYTCGKYEDAATLSLKFLQRGIEYFPLIEIFVKSKLFLDENHVPFPTNSCMYDAFQQLYRLVAMEGDSAEAYESAKILTIMYSETSWAFQLAEIMRKIDNKIHSIEVNPEPDFYARITLASDLLRVPIEKRHDFLNKSGRFFRRSVSVRLIVAEMENRCNKIEKLPVDISRKQMYIAKLLLHKDPEKADTILRQIDIITLPDAVEIEIREMRAKIACWEGNEEHAVGILLDGYNHNMNIIYRPFCRELYQMLTREYQGVYSVKIPVFYALCQKHEIVNDSDNRIDLEIAYSEYLDTMNILLPSELFNNIGERDWTWEHNFFLEAVCVPKIMEGQLVFESSSAVLKERIAIYRKLKQLKPACATMYNEEILKLRYQQWFQENIYKVERDKLYLDLDEIRERIFQGTNDFYNQFRVAILRDTLSTGDSINERSGSIEEKLQKHTFTRNHLRYINEFPSAELLKKARDIFTRDRSYGLDAYVSTRIRHGALQLSLRKVFLRNKLITSKNANGEYEQNSFWIRQESEKEASDILNVLKEFAAHVDEEILYIKNELLQIQTETENPNGMFDYTITEIDVTQFMSQMATSDTAKTFSEKATQYFLERTKNNLDKIQTLFNDDLLRKFCDMLDQLLLGLRPYFKYIDHAELNRDITQCRTELRVEMLRIGAWFSIEKPEHSQDYPLLFAIQSAETLEIEHEQDLISEIKNPPPNLLLKGESLRSMVEIFRIIFGNALHHCSVKPVQVAIDVQQENKKTVFCFANPARNISNENIEELNKQLKDWRNNDAVLREGGTGLQKIMRIIDVELHVEGEVHVELTRDGFFCVYVEMNIGELLS